MSTAISADNPEVVEARRRGIPVRHRSELLAALMTGYRGLAVAGAHGKSTTSAMLWTMLGDASACIGATVDGGGGTGAVSCKPVPQQVLASTSSRLWYWTSSWLQSHGTMRLWAIPAATAISVLMSISTGNIDATRARE